LATGPRRKADVLFGATHGSSSKPKGALPFALHRLSISLGPCHDGATRRALHATACYFFTVNLRDWRSDLLLVEIVALRDAVRAELARLPFHIDAWVVLPDHMHCQWTLPEGDADFSGRMREIKAGFTRRIAPQAERTIGTLRQRESGIWQRRFWEHTIRDERDYAAHMDYIHFNPVKHGLVTEARAWEYSSFRRCVAAGLYPPSWDGAGGDTIYGGERE
jgi:putative transposase